MEQDNQRSRTIKSWLAGQPVDIPAPAPPHGFTINREPAEQAEVIVPSCERLGEVVGNVYGLTYCNTNGKEDGASIRISHVDYLGDAFYVGAYCFERQAYRTFRVDRMMELINLRTGEVHDSAMHWCRGLVAAGSAEEMMRVCIHDLNILWPSRALRWSSARTRSRVYGRARLGCARLPAERGHQGDVQSC